MIVCMAVGDRLHSRWELFYRLYGRWEFFIVCMAVGDLIIKRVGPH